MINNKIIRVLMCTFALCISLAINLEAKEVDSSCIEYTLQSDSNEVEAGREFKVTLSYQSVTPMCSPTQLLDETVTIDFSQVVGNYGSVTPSYDNQLINIDISPEGLVTISFKDYDSIHNTLEQFSGSLIFTLRVDSEVEGDVVIENDVTSDITISVDPPSTDDSNTSKWSDQTYAGIGDVIDYNVRINTDQNEVESFQGIDSPAPGLTYVKDSFYVTDLATGNIVDETNYSLSIEDNNLIIENTTAFSSAYVLHYQMLVTSLFKSYTNNFAATYNTVTEESSSELAFDITGSSQVSFTNGSIDIFKVDNDNQPLANAEFEIRDENGDVVDKVTTDESGHAYSIELALGTYQVIETKAPSGYVLDETPQSVSIIKTEDGLNIAQLTVVNQIQETEKPETKQTADLQIYKYSKGGEPLASAQFEILDSEKEIVSRVTTNENGLALVSDLPLGTYSVIETKAPNGYILDQTPQLITLDTADQTYILEFTDMKEQPEIGGGKDTEEVDSEQESEEQPIVDNNEDVQSNEQETASESDRSADSTNDQDLDNDSKSTLAETGSASIRQLIAITLVLIIVLILKRKLNANHNNLQ